MFSNVWWARAAASHWLSPSVSMPTSRCMPGRLPILVGVADRDVPALGVGVEVVRQLGGVDLGDELDRRLDHEVAGAAQDAAEFAVHREGADLVRIGLPRLAV